MRNRLPGPGAMNPAGEWTTVKTLLPYLWPAGETGLRIRVVVAMALLVAAKATNVSVPIFYKQAVDILTAKGNVDAMIGVPVALIVAYGLCRVGALAFGELRDAEFVAAREAETVEAMESWDELTGELEQLQGGYAQVTGYSYAVPPCTGTCSGASQDLAKFAQALETTPLSVCVNAENWNDYTGGVMSAAACGPSCASPRRARAPRRSRCISTASRPRRAPRAGASTESEELSGSCGRRGDGVASNYCTMRRGRVSLCSSLLHLRIFDLLDSFPGRDVGGRDEPVHEGTPTPPAPVMEERYDQFLEGIGPLGKKKARKPKWKSGQRSRSAGARWRSRCSAILNSSAQVCPGHSNCWCNSPA